MKTFMLLGFILISTSTLAFNSVVVNKYEAKKKICKLVESDYSKYMREKECLTYKVYDHGDEFSMTFPFCADWRQEVSFTYYKDTGEILEGSSGDVSEYCESLKNSDN